MAELKKQKMPLWPEWTEADLNAEKWEVAGKVKEAKPGKSPSAPVNIAVQFQFRLNWHFYCIFPIDFTWFRRSRPEIRLTAARAVSR